MAPGKYNFKLYQGKTWYQQIRLRRADPPDGDGTAINITGKKFRMQLRSSAGSSTVVLSASTTDGRITIVTAANGLFQIDIPASAMAAISLGGAAKTYVYDLEMYDDSGSTEVVDCVLTGKVTIYPEVTRA